MVISSTARRYARAVFELAREKGQVEQVLDQLDSFSRLIETSAELKKLLEMPNRRGKTAIIEDILRDRYSDLFREFILLLLKNKRANLLPQIREEFHNMYDQLQSRVRATVISAIPLSEDLVNELKQRLEKKINANVIVENRIDPKILGGFIVQLNGKVLDASVVDKFNQLKMYLNQN